MPKSGHSRSRSRSRVRENDSESISPDETNIRLNQTLSKKQKRERRRAEQQALHASTQGQTNPNEAAIREQGSQEGTLPTPEAGDPETTAIFKDRLAKAQLSYLTTVAPIAASLTKNQLEALAVTVQNVMNLCIDLIERNAYLKGQRQSDKEHKASYAQGGGNTRDFGLTTPQFRPIRGGAVITSTSTEGIANLEKAINNTEELKRELTTKRPMNRNPQLKLKAILSMPPQELLTKLMSQNQLTGDVEETQVILTFDSGNGLSTVIVEISKTQVASLNSAYGCLLGFALELINENTTLTVTMAAYKEEKERAPAPSPASESVAALQRTFSQVLQQNPATSSRSPAAPHVAHKPTTPPPPAALRESILIYPASKPAAGVRGGAIVLGHSAAALDRLAEAIKANKNTALQLTTRRSEKRAPQVKIVVTDPGVEARDLVETLTSTNDIPTEDQNKVVASFQAASGTMLHILEVGPQTRDILLE
ncbi:hypothetical protein HPB47_007031 [Ixodes persulcatus]|uniref:Uncharacterized protein n=1 Tax=Ixodes persulcatus TaxID=34615 RepID=A0AC60P9I8_IXOPE|nr:hypothetical protein HPB47_007031 [Ixodes persulcatus]